jgi:hypothetical protein
VWWGYPYWSGAYPYPYPAYAYSYPVDTYGAFPAVPESYGAPLPGASYWYYCQDTQAYYPYVKECPSGWLTVAPSAPPATETPDDD